MKILLKISMFVFVYALVGVGIYATANAWESMNDRGAYSHNMNFRDRGESRDRGMQTHRFERGIHDRSFVRFVPSFYGYYPGDYAYNSGNYPVCTSSYGFAYPAVGTLVYNLPGGASALVVNGTTIYTHDGVFYEYTPQGYVVVPPIC